MNENKNICEVCVEIFDQPDEIIICNDCEELVHVDCLFDMINEYSFVYWNSSQICYVCALKKIFISFDFDEDLQYRDKTILKLLKLIKKYNIIHFDSLLLLLKDVRDLEPFLKKVYPKFFYE